MPSWKAWMYRPCGLIKEEGGGGLKRKRVKLDCRNT